MKKSYLYRWFGVLSIVMVVVALPIAAHAALYWNHDVRSSPISVCFVGNAVSARQDRVEEILSYINEFEHYANIRFMPVMPGTWQCPSPTTRPDGTDFYNGDIRIVLPGTGVVLTGPIPGNGCTADSPGSSWSNPPDELEVNRSCLYNMKLGDDADTNGTRWLNHTLHEFGHALGLSHEHARSDANDSSCTESGYGGSANTGFMTPYDRKSVMHYQFLSCGIHGNYDHTGFSAWDKLALHILYPEENRTAEFVGKTVLRSGENLQLQSAWQWRGANIDFVAKNFGWRIDGALLSSGPTLNVRLKTGIYTLQYAHSDFLDRNYTYNGVVRVLADDEYDSQMAAIEGAQQAMRAEHATAMVIPAEGYSHFYNAVAYPVMSTNKDAAKPLGVGSVAQGGDALDIQIILGRFTGRVDIYLALYAPDISPVIFSIGPDLTLRAFEGGIKPWRAAQIEPLNESLFGRIPVSILPSGTYYLGLLATPAGSFTNHYFWITQFDIP